MELIYDVYHHMTYVFCCSLMFVPFDKDQAAVIHAELEKKDSAKPGRATKEGQWVLRTPMHIRAMVFVCSAWF